MFHIKMQNSNRVHVNEMTGDKNPEANLETWYRSSTQIQITSQIKH